MIPRTSRVRSRTIGWIAVATALVAGAREVRAQTRWTVQPKTSLGWWQVNPHLNHLWATTCPEEPSWRPGEGRSEGWSFTALRVPKHGFGVVSDTTIVPLYPRYEALPLCTEAVSGEVFIADTTHWRGIRGHVTVKADKLITGMTRRDEYARQAVLQTERYPDITFYIDSVVGVTETGDTVSGVAYGTLALHGVTRPTRGPVRAWHETEGLRVVGRARIPALALVGEFGISQFALGLGVMTRIWLDIFMGVDVILHPQTTAVP